MNIYKKIDSTMCSSVNVGGGGVGQPIDVESTSICAGEVYFNTKLICLHDFSRKSPKMV